MNRKERAALQDLAEKLIDLSNGKRPSTTKAALAKILAKEANVTVEVSGPSRRRVRPTNAADTTAAASAKTRRVHVHGTSDLPDGTELYTVVRMERKAAGQRRRISAKVRGGLVFVEGRRFGVSGLAKALESARAVAGKATRKGSGQSGTRAWRVATTNETVEDYRRNKGSKPRKATQMSLPL